MWFYWHVLSKQRSGPLVTGFSSIRVSVTQPLLGLLDYRKVQVDTEKTLDIHPLYKGDKAFIFPSRAQSNPSPTPSSNTRSSGQVLRTFNHVRIQPSRPVDVFLRYGGGHQEVEGGQISDRQNFASAARPRAGRPYSRTQRERRVRIPLPPRTRPRSGSLC